MKKIVIFFVLTGALFFSCTTNRRNQQTTGIQHLRFLSKYVIPYNYQFQNTTVGGLSGIDYDRQSNQYFFISDDRSDKNPARFYEASIFLDNDKIDSVVFGKVIFLKGPEGREYPNSNQDPYHTPDPEALRFDSMTHRFIWSSEGERLINASATVLENPAVTQIDTYGNFIDTFVLPPQVKMSSIEFGPRQNGVFEGLTFTDDNNSLIVSVEEPLLQDGSAAGTGDSSGLTRMIKFNIAGKKPVAQFAYKIDPVAHPPVPAGAFKINGISDILSVDNDHLLVIERSFSSGNLSCTIKVYVADISKADNIAGVSSLKDTTGIKIIPKKLLLNMDNLGMFIDNIEGVTFGPLLPDGKRSLLFIADNNFNPLEQTQILLFEVD